MSATIQKLFSFETFSFFLPKCKCNWCIPCNHICMEPCQYLNNIIDHNDHCICTMVFRNWTFGELITFRCVFIALFQLNINEVQTSKLKSQVTVICTFWSYENWIDLQLCIVNMGLIVGWNWAGPGWTLGVGIVSKGTVLS